MKEERKARWQRRKSKGNTRTQRQGMVAGNPRYSGKNTWGGGKPQRRPSPGSEG